MTTPNYSQARELMVEQQVRPWDVLDLDVLDVLASLPREAFLPEIHRALAYADIEIPLGHGASTMKPVVEGRMLQALELKPGEDVLEIGTGSGYISACLGRLARAVLSLEIRPELAQAARANLDRTGLGSNVRIETADALHWDSERRFDAICVTGAVDAIPAAFVRWLRPGGRLFVVHGRSPVMEAVRVRAGGTVNAGHAESLFETELAYLVGAEPTSQFTF